MRAPLQIVPWLVLLGLLTLGGCKTGKVPTGQEPGPDSGSGGQGLFDLRVEPGSLFLRPGDQTKVQVIAQRKGYQGDIAVELVNLPAGVRASPATIAAGKEQIEIEVTATNLARETTCEDVKVMGFARGASNLQVASPTFNLVVGKVGDVPPPPPPPTASFELRVEPTAVKVEAGTKTPVRVLAQRKNYQGPILVELVNLPANLSASRTLMPEGRDSVDIEILAAGNATRGKVNLHALGSTVAGANFQAPSPSFTVQVTEPVKVRPQTFEVSVAPAAVRIAQGEKARVRVVAQRKGYDGPIAVELANLPAFVEAPKGMIPRGQNSVDIELTVGDRATVALVNLAVFGNAIDVENQLIASSPFTLTIVAGKAPPTPAFDIHVETVPLRLYRGDKAKVKVNVVRRGYDGPITAELLNLPARVISTKDVIPRGQNSVELEVTVPPAATLGDKADVIVQGMTSGNQTIHSPKFQVSVQEAAFEISVETPGLKLMRGDKVKVKVNAVRLGYRGPIAVELRGLPAHVHAPKEVIPAGQNSIEINLTVDPKAEAVDKANIQAAGTSTTGPNLSAFSRNFPLTVQVPPAAKQSIEVRVENKQIKLGPGDRAKLKVTVVRKNYDGPIALEMLNLPNQVVGAKVLIPAGQNAGEIELMAGPKVTAGMRDIKVGATAVQAPNVQDTSPAITLILVKK